MSNIKTKVAILGSSGHIGKNLINFFSKDKNYKICLFTRDKNNLNKILGDYFPNCTFNVENYEQFGNFSYDVVINCVGASDPYVVDKDVESIFRITEFYDNKLIEYIKKHSKTMYLNISSGAVYGQEFKNPANDSTLTNLDVNNLSVENFYSMIKIYSETKHRVLSNLNIIDLRLFAFFSRFIDIKTKFFICDVVQAIKKNEELIVNPINFFRDYVNPEDLYSLIIKCINKKNLNDSFDVFSKSPISKFEILELVSKKYDLKHKIQKNLKCFTPTGIKEKYYSESKKATKLGYFPKFSSQETILEELEFLLASKTNSI